MSPDQDPPRALQFSKARWFNFPQLFLAVFWVMAGSGWAAESNRGLSAGPNGTLRLNGKAFRGLGVTYYDAFVRLLDDGKIQDVAAGFRVLASNQIPFVRFAADGYWPVNWGLYQTNRQAYFARLDQLV